MGRTLEQLRPPTRWLGRRLEVYRSVSSTNLVAEELARAGAPAGTLVIADAQTAGRGRLGRTFFSPGGRSIYLSVLLRPQVPLEAVHRYVFCAAVAVATTVRTWVGSRSDVAIKWPNDVLLNGRKVSGINLPVQLDGHRVTSAILGIGVNVNLEAEELPPELREVATSLRIANGVPVDRVGFAEALIEGLEQEIDRLHTQGFAAVLEAWKKFSRMQGVQVRVHGPGVRQEFEGTVEGVDPDGALLLRTEGGTIRVLAGDVSLTNGGR